MLFLYTVQVKQKRFSYLRKWIQNHYKYICRFFFNLSYRKVSFFLHFVKIMLSAKYQVTTPKLFTRYSSSQNIYWKSVLWYFIYQFITGRRRWFSFENTNVGYFLSYFALRRRVNSSVRSWWWKQYLPKQSRSSSKTSRRRFINTAVQKKLTHHLAKYKRKWQLWIKKWFFIFNQRHQHLHWRAQKEIRHYYLKLFLSSAKKKWFKRSLRKYFKAKFGFKVKKLGNRSFSSSANMLGYLSYRRRKLRKRKLRRLVPWKHWYWQYLYQRKSDRHNLCYESLSILDRYVATYGSFLNSIRYLYYVLSKYVGHLHNIYLNIIYVTRRLKVRRKDKAIDSYGFSWYSRRWKQRLYKRKKRWSWFRRHYQSSSKKKKVYKTDSFWRQRLGIIQLDIEFICSFLSKYLSLKSSSRTMMIIVWRVVGWLRKLIQFEKVHYYVMLGGKYYIFKLRRVRLYIHGRFSKRARRKHKMLVDIGRYYKFGLRSKRTYLYYSSLDVPLKKASCAIHLWFFYERKLVAGV